jgi:hypothetical protein
LEYAGAVEADPPFRADESGWLAATGWSVARDGRSIRPRRDSQVDQVLRTLRELVAFDLGRRSYDGSVAAYDPETRELVVIAAAQGRVGRRTLRKPRLREESNVVDLAGHRRTAARALRRPIA